MIVPAQATQLQPLAADGQVAVEHAELDPLPGHGRAHRRGPAEQHLGGGDGLLGEHGDGTGFDDAALIRGDFLDRAAQVPGVVQGDRGDHGDRAVGDVGGVPGAAHADLDDRDVHRGVGERGEGHAGQHLEERHGHLVPTVHHRHVRRDLLVQVHEALPADRLRVQGDPLAHGRQVGAGEQPRAQAAGAQQRVDHPGGRGLAVRPRDVDDGAGALRVAEQAGEVGDPVQRRVDGVLGPAGSDPLEAYRHGCPPLPGRSG